MARIGAASRPSCARFSRIEVPEAVFCRSVSAFIHMSNSPGGSLDRAFEELIQRVVESTMNSVRGDLARIAASAAQSALSAVPGTAAPAAPAAQDGRLATVQQAMESILSPASQTDIMSAALQASATAAGSAALLVRRGDNFSVWRSEGVSADAAASLRSLSGATATAGAFKLMCDGGHSVTAAASAGSWPPGIEPLAGASGNISLLPILVAGRVVAAIAAAADGTKDSAANLEIIARVAGLSLETAGGRAAASAPAAAPAPAPAAATPSAPAPAAEPSAPAPAAAPAAPDGSRGSFAEMLPASAGDSTLPPPPDISGLTEAEQDAHRKAHRFARVAVQDLMSYHKAKIADGRNNRNLYDLLRDDVEKTRENYQKKFASTAAAAFDYLHYEMVSKLAGNDPEVLGANYPGPVTA